MLFAFPRTSELKRTPFQTMKGSERPSVAKVSMFLKGSKRVLELLNY
jgi:hypothetical protein